MGFITLPAVRPTLIFQGPVALRPRLTTSTSAIILGGCAQSYGAKLHWWIRHAGWLRFALFGNIFSYLKDNWEVRKMQIGGSESLDH